MRKKVVERRQSLKKTELRVFNAMVVLTLIYGCKTWTMQRRHESNLQASKMFFKESRKCDKASLNEK